MDVEFVMASHFAKLLRNSSSTFIRNIVVSMHLICMLMHEQWIYWQNHAVQNLSYLTEWI